MTEDQWDYTYYILRGGSSDIAIKELKRLGHLGWELAGISTFAFETHYFLKRKIVERK